MYSKEFETRKEAIKAENFIKKQRFSESAPVISDHNHIRTRLKNLLMKAFQLKKKDEMPPMDETGMHPGELKDMVASPGGTTITALHEIEKGKLRATLISAVEAATLKSKSLK